MPWLDGTSTPRTGAQLEAALRAIVNALTSAALSITQTGNTSASTSVGGALNVNNTQNSGAGIVVYSAHGTPLGRLIVARADNPTFAQTAMFAQQAGTGHALHADLTATNNLTGSAINATSANTGNSCVFLSGVELNRATLKIAHTGTGTDANAAGISIDLLGSGTAAQGIFLDATGGGTTGDLLDLRNNSVQLFKVKTNGYVQYGNGGPLDGFGTGSPEGVVTGVRGSTWRRTDGGTGTTLYRKEAGTGNTGWVAVATPPPNSNEATRYVSGNGSDSSDGLTPQTPKRTLAAAYADLPTPASAIAGVGTIWCAPGRYDVGTGLALTRGKPVKIIGSIPPPPYVTSTLTAPLSINCAIIYTSTGAASMITTIAGTAATNMLGLHFENLLFEFSNAATTIGIDMNSCWYPTVNRCYFFADKTTGPAAVTAQGFFLRDDTTYGGAGTDCSWGRFDDNKCINMALGTVGDTNGNNNHQIFTRNHGFGISHSNTSALPFITVVNGNRCAVIDTNIEAYNIGIKFDSCWECREEGTGGEFCDVLIDAYNTKGCTFTPNGQSNYALGSTTPIVAGALIFRGDSFTKANIINLASVWYAGNTQRLWLGIDDALSLASHDNLVVSPASAKGEYVTSQAANYTLVIDDAGTIIETTKATAFVLTVPPNSSVAFPVGTIVDICQYGAGQVTLTPGAGVTLTQPTGAALTTRAQFSTVSLRKRATNEWIVSGDLT